MNRVLLKVDKEFLCYQLQFPGHRSLRRTLVQHNVNQQQIRRYTITELRRGFSRSDTEENPKLRGL